MRYNFLVFRKCLDGTNKMMSCKDHSVALRVFTSWIELDSAWVEILKISETEGLKRRMLAENTPCS